MKRREFCPCGCEPDRPLDCVTTRPVPDVDGHCCGRLGFEELQAARAYGWHCAAGCVAARMRTVVWGGLTAGDLLEYEDYEARGAS
jgi:hypothetical protein